MQSQRNKIPKPSNDPIFDDLSTFQPLGNVGDFPNFFEEIDFDLGSVPSDDTASLTVFSGVGTSLDCSIIAYASRTSPSASGSGSNEPSPDSYLLPVNELKLLRAAHLLGERPNAGCFMDLAAVSPFNLGASPSNDQLPAAWQPTATQMQLPHHPVVDFLPWPSCRDRILDVLSLPDELRPPTARGDLALVNVIYDMEDSSEGIRIWVSDPYDAKSWEVGQVFFERWWFVFDRGVVERSNHLETVQGGATTAQVY